MKSSTGVINEIKNDAKKHLRVILCFCFRWNHFKVVQLTHWISWKEIKWRKKNIFRAVFLLLFIWNHFGSGQIPIRSSRWMNTCCLICDMTIFHWIFEKKRWYKKNTFWRRKITSPSVFPLYLVAITSNLANYQLGALDGWRHAVRYAIWLYFFEFLKGNKRARKNHF